VLYYWLKLPITPDRQRGVTFGNAAVENENQPQEVSTCQMKTEAQGIP
jgi:hypothetical protein